MKRRNNYPSTDRLKELFDYRDGRLIWKDRPLDEFKNQRVWNMRNVKYAGKEAGSLQRSVRKGKEIYRWMISIDRKLYYRSNLVWIYHDKEPLNDDNEVDHKNNNMLDDRIENLRISTRSQNCANKKIKSTNTTGYKNVRLRKDNGKYTSSICVDGDSRYLGQFDTAIEAHQAYTQAANELYGEFANAG